MNYLLQQRDAEKRGEAKGREEGRKEGMATGILMDEFDIDASQRDTLRPLLA